MAHTVELFFLLHPSLCLVSLFSPFFLVSVTASDSGWQPPGFLKANITAKDELQVCQACKHALITHFPADDNEVSEIAAALSVCVWGGGLRQPTCCTCRGLQRVFDESSDPAFYRPRGLDLPVWTHVTAVGPISTTTLISINYIGGSLNTVCPGFVKYERLGQ